MFVRAARIYQSSSIFAGVHQCPPKSTSTFTGRFRYRPDHGDANVRSRLARRYTITADAQVNHGGSADTRARRTRRWTTTEAQMHEHGGRAGARPQRRYRYTITTVVHIRSR